ncbi:MAG: DUF983 domain-containing protein [Hyphomicrobiales bacterium]
MDENFYPDISPLKTGLAGTCPRCGRGRFFSGYLTVGKRCSACGLDYSFADNGDGAAWFVMLIACVLGVGSMLGVEIAYQPAWWVHVLVAIPVLIIIPALLLRPMKGVLLAQQWKTNAHEGRLQK